MKPAPIKEAERIGKAAGADRVAVLMLDDSGTYAWTTWGRSRADCEALKRWGAIHAEGVLIGMNDAK